MRQIRRLGVKALRKALRKHDELMYHQHKNGKAREAYRSIVAHDPGRRLTDRMRREISEYARSVLGSPVFSPWLEAYAAYRGAFHAGWIPENYLAQYVTGGVPKHYRTIGVKTLAGPILQTDAFPDLAYRIDRGFYDSSMNPLGREDLARHVFAEHDVVYVKLEESSYGLGVLRLGKSEFSLDRIEKLGNLVIQRPVAQHPFFDAFSPRAAATLRITTVNANGGGAEVRAAYLRLGRSTDDIVKSERAVRVPVDMKTGALQPEGCLPDWSRTDRHPDTGTPFAGARVPAFDKVVETCLALHGRVPHVRVAGWDACVGADAKPVLFELNTNNPDTRFIEAATGPVFLGLGWDSLHKQAGIDLFGSRT